MSKKDIKKPQSTNKQQPKAFDSKANKATNSKNNSYQLSTNNYQLKQIIYLAVILVITFISYSNTFNNKFINAYDDKEFFLDNPYIKGLTMDSVKTIFATPHWSANYIPLTTFTWAVEYNHFKLNPKPYIIDNLILHLLNTILVFFLIFILTGFNKSNKLLQTLDFRLQTSFIVALLFGIHPMHVESVTWLSERKDVLYVFFYLLSLIAYIRYFILTNHSNPKRSVYYYLAAIFLFILSALSKSAAITLPIVFLLIDWYFSRKFTIKLLLEKIPFFIVSLIIGIAAIKAQQSVGAINLLYDFNFIDKIFLFTYSIAYYIVSFIIPFNFAIIHFYPNKVAGWLPVVYYLSPIFLAIIGFIIIKSGNLKKDLIFGFSFFIIGLLLVMQFIPLGPSVVSERYTYIPYIGLGYILARIFIVLNHNYLNKSVYYSTRIFIISLGLFFIVTTYNLNKVWKDSVSLFQNLADKYPDSDMANYDLGYAIMQAGHNAESIPYFTKAINLNHDYATAYVSRGLANHYLSKHKEEIPDYTEALRINPNYFEAYNNRGTANAMLANYAAAIQDYNKALNIKSDYGTYLNRANAKLLLPDYKNAIDDYSICLKYNTHDPTIYYNRATAEYNSGDHQSACNDWQAALQIGYKPADEKLKQFCK